MNQSTQGQSKYLYHQSTQDCFHSLLQLLYQGLGFPIAFSAHYFQKTDLEEVGPKQWSAGKGIYGGGGGGVGEVVREEEDVAHEATGKGFLPPLFLQGVSAP